jgi:putative peptide zinc metalloprotease protein
MRRLTTALVLAVVALAGAAGPAAAQDNAAVAINTQDDSTVIDLAFAFHPVGGDVVDQGNAAVAYASCERCETAAIAIQVLLVMSEDPSAILPTNLAIAINDQCISCTTLALAYQFVIGSGEPVRLTPEGRLELVRIRLELQRLRNAGLGAAELAAQVASLVDDLRVMLENELVPAGPGDQGDGGPDESQPAAEPDAANPESDSEPPAEEPSPSETAEEPATEPAQEPVETAPEEEPQPTETQEQTPPPTETTPEPAPDGGQETTTTPAP